MYSLPILSAAERRALALETLAGRAEIEARGCDAMRYTRAAAEWRAQAADLLARAAAVRLSA